MIAKVTRGDRMRGLVIYLFGPGRHEEHRDPRLVAGWEPIEGDGRLTSGQLDDLVADLDAPRRLRGTPIAGGYVWQCSLRNHDDDRVLTDAEWADIARETIARLGFDRGCRWIAVRHADDHIHLAVDLVREDGRVARLSNDRRKLSAACAHFERRYGLLVRAQRDGTGMPGLARAEIEQTARTGAAEPDRTSLARAVRAAAAAARTEAEFVDRLGSAGLLVRARWASGEHRRVIGYSVAAPATESRPQLWYGGGTLAGDLSLPRLRAHWTRADPDAPGRWAAASRTGPPPKASTRRTSGRPRLRADAWAEAGRVVEHVRQRLAAVPAEDHAAWTAAAAAAAGTLSSIAARVEADRPGQLSRAADELARAAQRPATDRGGPGGRGAGENDPLLGMAGVARTAADALLIARGGHTAVAVVLAQLGRLIRQIERAHTAAERAEQARRIHLAAEELLAWVHAPPPTPTPVRAREPAAPSRPPPGSPSTRSGRDTPGEGTTR